MRLRTSRSLLTASMRKNKEFFLLVVLNVLLLNLTNCMTEKSRPILHRVPESNLMQSYYSTAPTETVATTAHDHRQLLATTTTKTTTNKESSPSPRPTAAYSFLGISVAFNVMAHLTGSLGADSALPPSKVADYFGSEQFLSRTSSERTAGDHEQNRSKQKQELSSRTRSSAHVKSVNDQMPPNKQMSKKDDATSVTTTSTTRKYQQEVPTASPLRGGGWSSPSSSSASSYRCRRSKEEVVNVEDYEIEKEKEKEKKRLLHAANEAVTRRLTPLSTTTTRRTNKRNSESLNDIRRRISQVVLPMLSAAQRAALISLTRAQSTLTLALTAKRLNLIQAFRKFGDNSTDWSSSSADRRGQMAAAEMARTTAVGSNNLTTLNLILNLTSVIQTSAEIYALDGQIALERAMVYADIINSFTPAQKQNLQELSDITRPVSSWMLFLPSTAPTIRSSDIRCDHHHEQEGGVMKGDHDPENLQQNNLLEGVLLSAAEADHDAKLGALAGYATDIFAWLTGDISRDAHLAPDRIAPYFGGLYLKHTSSIWQDVSLLDFPGEDTVAPAIRKALSTYQLSILDHLVAAQEGLLRSILDVRTKICTQLRSLLVDDLDKVPHQSARKLRHQPPYNVDDTTTVMIRSQRGSQSVSANNATASTGPATTTTIPAAATGAGGTSSTSIGATATTTTSKRPRRRLLLNLQPTVLSLAKQYGRLDGEVAYLYANALAQLRRNITDDSLTQFLLQSVRDSIFNVLPNGAYHLISSIPLPALDSNNLTDYIAVSLV